MLAKSDFKQIGKIVQQETPKLIRKELKPIKDDIAQIRKDIKIEDHLKLQPLH